MGGRSGEINSGFHHQLLSTMAAVSEPASTQTMGTTRGDDSEGSMQIHRSPPSDSWHHRVYEAPPGVTLNTELEGSPEHGWEWPTNKTQHQICRIQSHHLFAEVTGPHIQDFPEFRKETRCINYTLESACKTLSSVVWISSISDSLMRGKHL